MDKDPIDSAIDAAEAPQPGPPRFQSTMTFTMADGSEEVGIIDLPINLTRDQLIMASAHFVASIVPGIIEAQRPPAPAPSPLVVPARPKLVVPS